VAGLSGFKLFVGYLVKPSAYATWPSTAFAGTPFNAFAGQPSPFPDPARASFPSACQTARRPFAYGATWISQQDSGMCFLISK